MSKSLAEGIKADAAQGSAGNRHKSPKPRPSIWRDRSSWELLALCIPALVGYVLFHYVPMVMAVMIPFKNYKFSQGILKSAWVGLSNFSWLVGSDILTRSMRNTVLYSVWFLIIGPAVNVLFALLLFEVHRRGALKFYQTVITFPNFISIVIVGYITYAIFSPNAGVLNQVRALFGYQPIDVYMNTKYWPGILTVVNLWCGVGMGSMMYFASLMGIDTTLFEAAKIDGASRWQQTRFISLPHLIPLVCIFTILGVGGIFGGSFDLFYVIPRNIPTLYDTTDVLSTYVFRALQKGSYSMGATVGFFQSTMGLILVVITNLIVRKISPENSLF